MRLGEWLGVDGRANKRASAREVCLALSRARERCASLSLAEMAERTSEPPPGTESEPPPGTESEPPLSTYSGAYQPRLFQAHLCVTRPNLQSSYVIIRQHACYLDTCLNLFRHREARGERAGGWE